MRAQRAALAFSSGMLPHFHLLLTIHHAKQRPSRSQKKMR